MSLISLYMSEFLFITKSNIQGLNLQIFTYLRYSCLYILIFWSKLDRYWFESLTDCANYHSGLFHPSNFVKYFLPFHFNLFKLGNRCVIYTVAFLHYLKVCKWYYCLYESYFFLLKQNISLQIQVRQFLMPSRLAFICNM